MKIRHQYSIIYSHRKGTNHMVKTLSEITKLWDKTLKRIQKEMNNDPSFDYFFSNSYIHEISGDTLVIVAPSLVAKAVIEDEKNIAMITNILSELDDEDYKLKVVTAQEIDKLREKNRQEEVVVKKENKYFENMNVNNKLTFSNFVVGEFNQDAHKAALFVARNGGTMFNPLFIYSHSGLGKTHLLHAIGNEVKATRLPNAKILYIPSNDFVEEYIKYIRVEKDSQSIKDYFKDVDVLLFDDVQFLADKVKSQEFFFFVYQELINSGKRIIITSDKQPNEIKGLEERLVTRFTQGLTVKINEPDTDTCVEILKQKITSLGLDVKKFDENVIYFLAEKFSRDVRELEGALNSLMFNCLNLLDSEKITMDVAIKAVSSIKGGKHIATQLSEQKIVNIVAEYYNITPSQVTGKERTGQIVLARHIAMYLIRKHLDVPLKKIGDLFGGKDHTTVMSAITKVDKELKTDEQLKAAINELEKKIKE